MFTVSTVKNFLEQPWHFGWCYLIGHDEKKRRWRTTFVWNNDGRNIGPWSRMKRQLGTSWRTNTLKRPRRRCFTLRKDYPFSLALKTTLPNKHSKYPLTLLYISTRTMQKLKNIPQPANKKKNIIHAIALVKMDKPRWFQREAWLSRSVANHRPARLALLIKLKRYADVFVGRAAPWYTLIFQGRSTPRTMPNPAALILVNWSSAEITKCLHLWHNLRDALFVFAR